MATSFCIVLAFFNTYVVNKTTRYSDIMTALDRKLLLYHVDFGRSTNSPKATPWLSPPGLVTLTPFSTESESSCLCFCVAKLVAIPSITRYRSLSLPHTASALLRFVIIYKDVHAWPFSKRRSLSPDQYILGARVDAHTMAKSSVSFEDADVEADVFVG